MINNPTSPALITTRSWRGTPTWALMRFLFVITLLCVVACLYFWQVSNIMTIRSETNHLRDRAVELERTNASLMLQVAAWNRPDYIQAKASEIGLVPVTQPRYVELRPIAPQATTPMLRQPAVSAWWQQIAAGLQDRWAGWAGSAAIPRNVAQASR